MLELRAILRFTESRNTLDAMRFEPAVYHTWERDPTPERQQILADARMRNAPCSDATARMICSTSWGAYQIMGFNIYGVCNGSCRVSEFLHSATTQEEIVNEFLHEIGMADTTWHDISTDTSRRLQFISKWNGPASVDLYWALMQKSAEVIAASTWEKPTTT